MGGEQEKEFTIRARMDKKIRLRDHRLSSLASLLMIIGNPQEGFLHLTLTLMMVSYNDHGSQLESYQVVTQCPKALLHGMGNEHVSLTTLGIL